METLRELLVISGRLENRKTLLRILDDLPVLVFSTATVDHAREVLATHSIELIFCEENFPDGSYKDLLKIIRLTQPQAHFVLMLCTGAWSEYLEAMSLGAWEVLRSPLQPTDVEFLVNRSTRERTVSCTAPAETRFLIRAASGSGAN